MAQPDQVVLITGASKGFGFAAAQELAARGHHVVATMRHPDRDGEAVRRGHESRIEATVCDVTDPASVRDAVAYALSRHGRIDVLVNNAGDVMWGAVEDLTDDELSLQLNTNVLGPLRLIRAVLPHNAQTGRRQDYQPLLRGRPHLRPHRGRLQRLQVRLGGALRVAAL